MQTPPIFAPLRPLTIIARLTLREAVRRRIVMAAGLLGRALSAFGLAISLAGLLTVIPALFTPMVAVFGPGMIVWSIWVGVALLRRQPAAVRRPSPAMA